MFPQNEVFYQNAWLNSTCLTKRKLVRVKKQILAEKMKVVLSRYGAFGEIMGLLFILNICRLTIINSNISIQEYHICFGFYLKIFHSFFSHIAVGTYISSRCFVIFVSLKEKWFMCIEICKNCKRICIFQRKLSWNHVCDQRVINENV